ncbi:MAG TPA: SGNH/GDSL hydrolase family protein [Polyangiaceae bacterium]
MSTQRINLLAKGTVEVHDPLLFARVGGRTVWNGINEVLRGRDDAPVIRVQHELGVRFDQVLQAPRDVPPELSARALRLGEFALESQFGTRVFSADADAVVLSIFPDVVQRPMVHREEGYLFCAANVAEWTLEDRAWVLERFAPQPPLGPDESMANLASVVERIRARRDCPVLVMNASPAVPGEKLHWYLGARDALSVRIRRFNLALIDLATSMSISIVDVEAALARVGTDRAKISVVHYTPAGHRAIAEEVVRVLTEHGLWRRAG